VDAEHPLSLEELPNGQTRLVWNLSSEGEWSLFQILLNLPQAIANKLNSRVVMVFRNFPHIRS
jgi:hypothetical protein